MWTRCVTLLLCTVCGLTLHTAAAAAQGAGDGPARLELHEAGIDWRPLAPKTMFGASAIQPSNALTAERCRHSSVDFVADQRPVATPFVSLPEQSSAPWLSAHDDLNGFLPGVWRDVQGIVRTENLLLLGAALGVAIGIRQDLDGQVRDEVAKHPERWGDAGRFLGRLGEAPIQVPILGLLWGTSFWTSDVELNGLSNTLLSAYAINGLSVLAIKGVTDTDRPDTDWNGGRWGFPSFHAASSFTIAGVLEEYYGWGVGVPSYLLAGLISWSRIDEQDHDLSDVVFGAALGWVIGKSVAGQHLRGDGRVVLLPWSHPLEPANGVAVQFRY